MTTIYETPTFEDELESFSEKIFESALGALELPIISMGRNLGLYEALRGGGGLTAAALGARAGVDSRYAREWLEHQAVSGIVTVDDPARPAEDRRYTLPESHAVALLDEEHPAFVGALAEFSPVIARTLDQVTDAFRTGAGIPYAAYDLHEMQAGLTRPMFANSLAAEWLGHLPELHGRLESGEPLRVADFGTGDGWAAIYLAEHYPNVRVDGFDLDDASIALARQHAADRGVADRVSFELCDITDADMPGPYDLVMCCEVIHDLPDPVGALAAMRHVVAENGEVLVIDERASDHFDTSGDPIERFLYAISILHCLPVGREAESSVATGTVMRPDTFRAYATEAGFADVDELPIEHLMFRFYRPAR